MSLKNLRKKKKTLQLPDTKKATNVFLYLIIFLLPLFFGIGKPAILDFNKQALLIFLILPALGFWLLRQILVGTLTLRFSFLDLLILLFLLLAILSTGLSRSSWGSFWGWPLDSGTALITLFSLAAFYFLGINLWQSKEEKEKVLILLASSASLVALVGILHLFGQFVIPFSFSRNTSFNSIGTVNAWGIFLAILLPLFLSLILTKQGKIRIALAGMAGLTFLGVLVTNYWLAWIGVLVGITTFLVFGLAQAREGKNTLFLLPMILFGLAVIFGIFKASLPGLPASPLVEVSPSYQATLKVSIEMLKQGIKELAFGWGPGTFKYGWSRFRPAAINQTFFWNLRFVKGGSQMAENLGIFGVLPNLVYSALLITALYLGSKNILFFQKEKKSWEGILSLGVFSSFVALSTISFLYPSNLTLHWLWWFLLAIFISFVPSQSRRWKLANDPRSSFLLSFSGILILLGGIFLVYLEGTRYLAEIKYEQALQASTLEQAARLSSEATRLNPNQEIFWQGLSQFYLNLANQEAGRTDLSDQERVNRVNALIVASESAARRASDLNSANVANWQTRGFIYRSLIGSLGGALEWAETSYARAAQLEPSNPFIYLELGRAYLTQASLEQKEERTALLEKAEANIRKAIELKGDYAAAYYQMAILYDLRGQTREAINTLEAIKAITPFALAYDPMRDVGLAFQLGVLYYREEEYQRSQQEFERVVALDPNYSNARYFLGLIYDRKGNKSKAIMEFEKIEGLNPENVEIKRILNNLRQGKPALEEITTQPGVLPTEEEPRTP